MVANHILADVLLAVAIPAAVAAIAVGKHRGGDRQGGDGEEKFLEHRGTSFHGVHCAGPPPGRTPIKCNSCNRV
jgi:hypothetical protein